ncbi:MAG TPA: YciI family protein [Burkholderiales bacterium]|nr:YciI family protein [Burkholderiales bacterium]
MQYLLMCCIDEKQWESIPQAQRDGIMQQYGEWVQDTTRSGHYQGGAKLRGTSSATTVREKNGRPVITDGPFAETKEQLGGYHVLECKDLNEALAVARRIPTLKVGGAIEVRPIDYPSGHATSAAADASQAPIIA